MDLQLLKALNGDRRDRRAAVLVTDLGDGGTRLVHEGDAVPGELGAAALTEQSLTATDLIRYLPAAIRETQA